MTITTARAYEWLLEVLPDNTPLHYALVTAEPDQLVSVMDQLRDLNASSGETLMVHIAVSVSSGHAAVNLFDLVNRLDRRHRAEVLEFITEAFDL